MPEETINPTPAAKPTDPDVEANKILAALSYVGVLCLVPLLAKKDSKFAQFHAKQGLVIFIGEVITMFLFFIPIISQVLMLGLAVVSILAILKVMSGEWWKIPYVYEWAQKINL